MDGWLHHAKHAVALQQFGAAILQARLQRVDYDWPFCSPSAAHLRPVTLNQVLWQQKLRLPLHKRLHRRPDQVAAQEYYVHKDGTAHHLELRESITAQDEPHNPGEARAARGTCH